MLTIRQNLLETIHGGNPDRFVNQYEFLKIIQNPLSLHNPRPPRGGADIPNAWGVTYSWPEHVVASFPVHTPEKVVIKDIRFGPQTDDHDFNFKLKHAIGFLQEGAKVRAYVFFKGRSILFKEQGSELLERFIHALEDYGKVESAPKLEGKRMIVVIAPKK